MFNWVQKYAVFCIKTNLKQHKNCLKRYNYKKILYICTRYVHT